MADRNPKLQAFLSRIEDANILLPTQWQAVEELADLFAQVKPFVQQLIQEQLLTAWQAKQLLTTENELVFGRYVLQRLIGQGGMGSVYQAIERSGMRRVVALKILLPECLADDATRKRFLREVRATSALNHPNIVTAYDADFVADRCFLAMEYVPGDNLSQWLARHGPLPIEWTCEAIRQTCLGLQHAHEHGYIHRDIKPANLLAVAPDVDTFPQVKLLDLGLVRLTAPSQDAGLTQTGEVIGTIDYMSLEQARGTSNADERSDIFSLGATLFRLLTGEVPFAGETPTEKLFARASKKAARLSSHRADVPEALDHLVACMLARRPGDRPQSAAEVAERLEGILHGEPSEAPATLSVAPEEASRFSRVILWSGAAGLFVVLFSGLLFLMIPDLPQSGELVVTVDQPDAEILIDGKLQQGSPNLLEPTSFSLSVGTHEVMIRKSGYEDETRRIEIKPGELEPLFVELGSPEASEEVVVQLLEQAKALSAEATTAEDWGLIANLLVQALGREIQDADRNKAETLLAQAYLEKNQRVVARVERQLQNQSLTQEELLEAREVGLNELREAIRFAPRRWENHFLQAKWQTFWGGDREQALNAVNMAHELASGQTEALRIILTLRAVLQTNAPQALRDFEDAIRLAPEEPSAYRARAFWWLQQQQFEHALDDLEQVYRLNPADTRADAVYRQLLSKLVSENPSVENLGRALKRFSDQPELWFARARAFAAQQQWELARDDLDECLSLRPDWAPAKMLRIDAYQHLKEWELALAEIRSLLASDPHNGQWIAVEIGILMNLRRIEEAESRVDEVIQDDKLTAQDLLRLGKMFIRGGKSEQGQRLLERALQLDAEHVETLRLVGELYYRRKEYRAALMMFRKVVQIAPDDIRVKNGLAWLLATAPEQELRNAAESLQIALEICEASNYQIAAYVHTLAVAYAESGDFQQALRWLNEADALDQDNALSNIEEQRKLFEQRIPFREAPKQPETLKSS